MIDGLFSVRVSKRKIMKRPSVADTQWHTGKTRCWIQTGRCPPNMVDFAPEAWGPQGVKVLGTPIGSPEFIKEVSDRLEEEQRRSPSCSARGNSFCSVQAFDATIPRTLPLRVCTGHATVGDSLGTSHKSRRRNHWRRCPREWVGCR